MATKLSTPQISTLMAEIRLLKIGNKQMTIAVFKQLYEKACYDENYNILYPIWGKINRGDDGEFVVFQDGNDLFRMHIPSKHTLYSFEYSLFSAISSNISTETGHIFDSLIKITDGNSQFFFERNGRKHLPSNTIPYSHECIKPHSTPSARIKSFIETIMPLFTEKEIIELETEYRIDRTRSEGQRKMVDKLSSSGQLFIAV